MSRKDIVSFGALLSLLILFVIGLYWIAGPYENQAYVGEVVSYTISDGPYLHTALELKTYSGSSIRIAVEGIVEPEIGEIIKITIKQSWNHYYPSLIDLSRDYTAIR